MSIVETKSLIIREFCIDDADLLFQYSQEASAKKELPDEVISDKVHAIKMIQMYHEKYSSEYPLVYAIELRVERLLIGHISLSPINEGIEIGYAIAADYQGQGYASEAVTAFSPWARTHMSLDKLYGLAKVSNVASWKTLEKAGYVFIKEERRKAWGKNINFRIYQFS